MHLVSQFNLRVSGHLKEIVATIFACAKGVNNSLRRCALGSVARWTTPGKAGLIHTLLINAIRGEL